MFSFVYSSFKRSEQQTQTLPSDTVDVPRRQFKAEALLSSAKTSSALRIAAALFYFFSFLPQDFFFFCSFGSLPRVWTNLNDTKAACIRFGGAWRADAGSEAQLYGRAGDECHDHRTRTGPCQPKVPFLFEWHNKIDWALILSFLTTANCIGLEYCLTPLSRGICAVHVSAYLHIFCACFGFFGVAHILRIFFNFLGEDPSK